MILFSVMVSRLFQLRFFLYKCQNYVASLDCHSAPSSYNNPKGKSPIQHHRFPEQKANNEVRISPSFGRAKIEVDASFDLVGASASIDAVVRDHAGVTIISARKFSER